MGKEAENIVFIRRRKERISREDRDIIYIMGRKVRRAAWERFVIGHIDLYDQPNCSYRNPIFLNPIAELSFHLSSLAEITKDDSIANLFAFIATELQEDKSSICKKILIRFAKIALSRAKQAPWQMKPIAMAA